MSSEKDKITPEKVRGKYTIWATVIGVLGSAILAPVVAHWLNGKNPIPGESTVIEQPIKEVPPPDIKPIAIKNEFDYQAAFRKISSPSKSQEERFQTYKNFEQNLKKRMDGVTIVENGITTELSIFCEKLYNDGEGTDRYVFVETLSKKGDLLTLEINNR